MVEIVNRTTQAPASGPGAPARGGGFLSAFGTIAGTIGSAYTSYAAAKVNKYAAQSEALSAEFNKQLAQFDVEALMRNRNQVLSKLRRKARLTRGSQRAAIAASGMALDYGSAQQIISDADFFAQVDERTVISDADKEAFAIKMQALGYSMKRDQALAVANQINPSLSAGITLLSGGAKAYETFGKRSGKV